MFQWYQDAEVCFVFLSDFEWDPDRTDSEKLEKLRACRWFTRGWTLQELIAPKNIRFYDHSWKYFGSKVSMLSDLVEITRIPKRGLKSADRPSRICVAQKMSWAASRVTTRVEDMAYCLMGIFDVNMPLLYGEGRKAFRRLQEEIIKSTHDLSLFAWTSTENSLGVERSMKDGTQFRGVLASHPSEFASCHDIFSTESQFSDGGFVLNNIGLSQTQASPPVPAECKFGKAKHKRSHFRKAAALSSSAQVCQAAATLSSSSILRS